MNLKLPETVEEYPTISSFQETGCTSSDISTANSPRDFAIVKNEHMTTESDDINDIRGRSNL